MLVAFGIYRDLVQSQQAKRDMLRKRRGGEKKKKELEERKKETASRFHGSVKGHGSDQMAEPFGVNHQTGSIVNAKRGGEGVLLLYWK